MSVGSTKNNAIFIANEGRLNTVSILTYENKHVNMAAHTEISPEGSGLVDFLSILLSKISFRIFDEPANIITTTMA